MSYARDTVVAIVNLKLIPQLFHVNQFTTWSWE